MRASIGGVFRDSKGQWITGFSMRVGMAVITRIEALAILEGLQLAWELGYKQVEVNCDNALLVDTFYNGFAAISRLNEIQQIHVWCSKAWKVKFCHVLKGTNKVADLLAKTAVGPLDKLQAFHVPPPHV